MQPYCGFSVACVRFQLSEVIGRPLSSNPDCVCMKIYMYRNKTKVYFVFNYLSFKEIYLKDNATI